MLESAFNKGKALVEAFSGPGTVIVKLREGSLPALVTSQGRDSLIWNYTKLNSWALLLIVQAHTSHQRRVIGRSGGICQSEITSQVTFYIN